MHVAAICGRQPLAFNLKTHGVEHTVRKRTMGLGIDSDGSDLQRVRENRCPVAVAVSETADHAFWPFRRT